MLWYVLQIHVMEMQYVILQESFISRVLYNEGSRDGPVVIRALSSHQCGPSLIPTWCYMWVDFFLPPSKKRQHISKFQFHHDRQGRI